jgi:hypothetical protein
LRPASLGDFGLVGQTYPKRASVTKGLLSPEQTVKISPHAGEIFLREASISSPGLRLLTTVAFADSVHAAHYIGLSIDIASLTGLREIVIPVMINEIPKVFPNNQPIPIEDVIVIGAH